LLNNFADRDPAKFLSGMDPRHAGALLVGQIVNLRRNGNPPAAIEALTGMAQTPDFFRRRSWPMWMHLYSDRVTWRL